MRWLRAVAALTALAGLLLGAPAALLNWGRYPVGWPDALTRPDDGSVLLVMLTAVGWVAWTAFAASTLAELVGLLRGRPLRIPLLGGMQRLCGALLLAAVALAPRTPTVPPSAPAHSAVAQSDPVAEVVPDAPEAEGPDAETYQVAPGDDLWTLSERLLGDGARWRELAAANPQTLADPTGPLTPGTRLAMPASGSAKPKQVTVRRGDTLSGLALEHLGAAGRWPRIAAANADVIEDPDHIEVGWRLEIPVTGTALRAEPNRERGTEKHPPIRDAAHDGDEARDGQTGPEPEPTPAQPADAPVEAPVEVESTGAEDEPAAEQPPSLPLLGTLGTLAAAAIIGVLETRRALRLRERPVGRRLLPPEAEAIRLRAAIGGRERPDGLVVLDLALRAIGRHCHGRHRPLPQLQRATVGADEIRLDWTAAAGPPPPGFSGTTTQWRVHLDPSPLADADQHPCPFPALVSLGSSPAGEVVLVDPERCRVLGVSAEAEELRRSALAAMGVELACAPWAAESTLLVSGAEAEVVAAAGGDRVHVLADAETAFAQVRSIVTARRAALGAEPLAALRVDPDRADAVAPAVFLLLDEVSADALAEIDEVLAGAPAGVAVIAASPSSPSAHWQVGGDAYAPTGRLAGTPDTLLAYGIPEATRAGLACLLRAAEEPTTTRAPWWSGTDDNVLPLPRIVQRGDEPVEIVRLLPAAEQPQVLLIGPTELRNAAGPEPSRSRQQLVELCAWLLEHPGSAATAMTASLGVAEGTRRSNLSRLRAWLGTDADGKPYLPDAYSGRILLHPAVTSDWHRLQLLLKPGIDRVGDSTLVAALELVRGAPLADAAPGQWHWAEELRTDISSALRDAALVLTERALDRGDIDLARWAAARALVVAPEDELLLCARIRTEHRAGNGAEVERLVNQVNRQARILGVDLLPETVMLCQEVVEGRLRARHA